VDENAGKLVKLLRLIGYDTLFFTGENDTLLVKKALGEDRIILTRDTYIIRRRLVTGGRVKALLIQSDDVDEQIEQVTRELKLDSDSQPFTICLECNQPLFKRTREEVKDRVPPYVWQTQNKYVECPQCRRIYWKGTHWAAMKKRLTRLGIRLLED